MKSNSLEITVERKKDVRQIVVHREFEKLVFTSLVMRAFLSFLGAARGCADFCESTAVSRVKEAPLVKITTKYRFLLTCSLVMFLLALVLPSQLFAA